MSSAVLLFRDPPARPLAEAIHQRKNELGASYQYEQEELSSDPHMLVLPKFRGSKYLEAGHDKNRTYQLRKASSLVPNHETACSVSAITKGGYVGPNGSARYPEPAVKHKFTKATDKNNMTKPLTLDKIRQNAQPADIIDGVENQASQITVLAGRRKKVAGKSREASVLARKDASVLRPREDFESTGGLYAAGQRRVKAVGEMAKAEKKREAEKVLKSSGAMGVYSNLLSGG